MKIHNVRLGHACNSSSSHSIVMLPDARDRMECDDFQYGWECFTLASPEEKMKYLAATLYNNLEHGAGWRGAAAIVKELTGLDLPPGDWRGGPLVYVDHQSLIALPRNQDGTVCREFFEELTDTIMRDGVVILGGNDNDGDHPLSGNGKRLDLPFVDAYETLVARKDEGSDSWTLFNKETGAKIRFSFSDAVPSIKSAAPELVDLKITDFCARGCGFCYQGSTPSGQHAEQLYLAQVASALKSMGVFEVAIGGGEPTQHPSFINIISNIKENGMNANFTTRNLDWLRDGRRADKILAKTTAFAYSVEDAAGAEEFSKAWTAYTSTRDYQGKHSVNLQCVIGVVGPYALDGIYKVAQYNGCGVVLLGYKPTGRGAKFNQLNYSPRQYHDVLKSNRICRVTIDTLLAQQWGDWLKEAGVSEVMYHTQEGKFSCYIDCVNKRIGPSSYCAESEYVPLPKPTKEAILEAYKRF